MDGIFFDIESYKFLLDNLILEAGVKPMFHVFAAGAIRKGNKLDGVIIESKEGRQAVLGKVIVDVTGSADIAWKSGAPCMDEGFPRGPKKLDVKLLQDTLSRQGARISVKHIAPSVRKEYRQKAEASKNRNKEHKF